MSTETSRAPGPTSPSRATETRVSVVIPVLNERENLPRILNEVDRTFLEAGMEQYRPYEIVFVEDESTDGTAAWIDEAAQANANVRAVHLRRAWGQSAALAAGFREAHGNYIVPMDGDGQNDPADIPRLLERLEEGHDCVSGRRINRQDPLSKRVPSEIQTHLAKLTGPDINDFGCTLKAYRSEALDDIDLYGEGHRYIPAKLYDKGYSLTEVNVNHRPREHGESRYGFGRLINGFADLVFHWFWTGYSSRPFHLFGGGGLLVMAFGFLLGVWIVGWNWVGGVQLANQIPELLLVVSAVLFGLLLTILGVILEFLTKLYYKDETEYRIERVVE